MNWDDFRYFLAVARTGRLSAAGKTLGVDHATVSRRIGALEKHLGTRLFERSPSGYALTEEGQQLVSNAEHMEAATIQAESTVTGQDAVISGTVRIGVPEGVAAYIVVQAAHKLCEEHPRLEIQLIALPRKFSLSKREADFVITVSRPETGRVRIQKISDYKLHLYATEDYLARNPTVEKVSDLQKLRGIAYVPELIFDKQLDYIPLVDPAFRPHLTSTSVHVQLEAVLNGAGVGIVHDFMASRHSNLKRVLPNEISFTRTFWSVLHEDYADIERNRICADAIVDHMRSTLRGP
ncbi:MAG: LysR family transcriptional regulator [Hyphomicrobiales bacterium]